MTDEKYVKAMRLLDIAIAEFESAVRFLPGYIRERWLFDETINELKLRQEKLSDEP